VGLFPIDKTTIDWLQKRADHISKRGMAGVPSDTDGKSQHPRLNHNRVDDLKKNILKADPDAVYAKKLTLDLSSVEPHVSGPNHVKTMTAISDISDKKVKINKAYLVSCVNSRVDDLASAARVVKGRKIPDDVKFYIAAASNEVQVESERRGDWRILIEAGARVLPPGCGPCIGLGTGLLEDGEVGISATNRNFKGRMGSKSAEVYLASPEVVAASAVAGYITGPKLYEKTETKGQVEILTTLAKSKDSVKILEGFPDFIEGELIFCHQDNLNTDGVYPGKYTYIDDFTPQQQAEVVMENYDPEFGKIVKEGDVLVGGFNFGTGSSREQAATALKYRGIKLVIAGSFSQTYARNALNNGFLVVDAPGLIRDLKEKFGADRLTVRTGIGAVIDVKKSILKAGEKMYSVSPIGTTAQELVLMEGLENWVRKNM
jgi:homoaconitate hydratase